MANPMITIHNVKTNEVIEREMTDAEFAIRKADLEAELNRKTEAEAKAQAKAAAQAKLATLGLTVEDLQALGL